MHQVVVDPILNPSGSKKQNYLYYKCADISISLYIQSDMLTRNELTSSYTAFVVVQRFCHFTLAAYSSSDKMVSFS